MAYDGENLYLSIPEPEYERSTSRTSRRTKIVICSRRCGWWER